MERNSYWPLNGPSSFRHRDCESRGSRCTKADVGIGPKLGGADDIPATKGFEETRRKRRRPVIPCESVRLVAVSDWILDDIGKRTATACSKLRMDYKQSCNPLPLRGSNSHRDKFFELKQLQSVARAFGYGRPTAVGERRPCPPRSRSRSAIGYESLANPCTSCLSATLAVSDS